MHRRCVVSETRRLGDTYSLTPGYRRDISAIQGHYRRPWGTTVVQDHDCCPPGPGHRRRVRLTGEHRTRHRRSRSGGRRHFGPGILQPPLTSCWRTREAVRAARPCCYRCVLHSCTELPLQPHLGFFGPVPGSLLRQVGRGYTDLLSALLSVGLEAAELQIWKEVDGIFTADPRKVATARLISIISPAEAAELTYYGSEVVHPFTMEQVCIPPPRVSYSYT
jgi:hypothetical protein